MDQLKKRKMHKSAKTPNIIAAIWQADHKFPADTNCRVSRADIAWELCDISLESYLINVLDLAIPRTFAQTLLARSACGTEYVWVLNNLGYMIRKLRDAIPTVHPDWHEMRMLASIFQLAYYAATRRPHTFAEIWSAGWRRVYEAGTPSSMLCWMCYTRSLWALYISLPNADLAGDWQKWIALHRSSRCFAKK